jgi:hypothetical protein
MNANSSLPATRRSWSRLFWTAGDVLAVAIGSFMLPVRQAQSSDQSAERLYPRLLQRPGRIGSTTARSTGTSSRPLRRMPGPWSPHMGPAHEPRAHRCIGGDRGLGGGSCRYKSGATGSVRACHQTDCGPLPSIGALKSEYLRCEYISSQRRVSMHGLAFCKVVSDPLLKREFGGDFDLPLAWSSTERQASAKEIDRQRTSFPAPS